MSNRAHSLRQSEIVVAARRLGARQRNVLKECVNRHGDWDGSGNVAGVWGSRSETASVLDALVKRGIASVTQDNPDPRARRYSLTALGNGIRYYLWQVGGASS